MTIAQALARLRALERQAAEGWPLGYEYVDIRTLAVEAIQVLDAAARTPEEARRLMAEIASTSSPAPALP